MAETRGGGQMEAILRGPTEPDGDEGGQPQYPPDHQPGMSVPQGGSMCANCQYLGPDQKSCTNEYFVEWNGSNVIPGPVDQYCSDWYEPAQGLGGTRNVQHE
jgi:hypothetical protein